MTSDPVGPARELLQAERERLGDLRERLALADAGDEALRALRTALRDLEGLFLVVVVGEYNAGKSKLINALLAFDAMPEGVTPTTDRVTVLTHGEREREEVDDGAVRREVPVEALRHTAWVDTPGTNAVIEEHEALTQRFVPRSDLVLFVTSADRPFTQSERRFLELIRSWGKKIVLVVNKMDLLEDEAGRDEVLTFVRQHGRATLEVEPPVFGVSARAATNARRAGDEAALDASGVPALLEHVEEHLGDDQRLRLKLANPLGVGERLARDAMAAVEERLRLLADDRATLDAVERQRTQFERDVRREGEGYLGRIKTALIEVERRGEVFLDERVRFGNVLELMRPERVRDRFVREVVRGADRQVDAAVADMVDWFLQRNLQLWEDVMGYVQERRNAAEDRVVGEVGGRFRMDRRELLQALRGQAETVLASYDEEREATRLADSLQQAVVRSGLVQASGVGVGAAVVTFLSGAALDVTGVTLGLAVVGVGAWLLPRRRARAKRELHDQMQALRDGLEESLEQQLNEELRRSEEALSSAISPYTRFVRSETERLEELREGLESSREALRALRRRVDALGGS